ncbi:M23 family metallopeptidase [Streptomyces stramineus]|uniref:M23 family metallopeptidase n=1 Tax=Streptomyces stramineus TaxID=173861 RepID=UPI00362707E7
MRPYAPRPTDAPALPDSPVAAVTGTTGQSRRAEWNPSTDSAFPVRGRHRVVKQRGGTMARSGAVLGVGVIAAVGAGGMATAQDRPTARISMPDLAQLPGVGTLLAGDGERAGDGGGSTTADRPGTSASGSRAGGAAQPGAGQPLTQAGLSAEDVARGTANAGEALRARILQQAEHQQTAADDEARASRASAAGAAQRKAAADRAAEAKAAADAAEAAREKAAEERAEKKEAAARARADGPAEGSGTSSSGSSTSGSASGAQSGGSGSGKSSRSTGSFALPVGSYTLTAGFGQSGNMWSANHTGQDFAAPTGTPVKAVGAGTITQAGWAGAYGYRVVLTLDDGTEVWFCHLSSMVVTSGKVDAGDVIGRVGATGNVTGPHLHMEVRPGGGAPVAPLSWLRGKGLQP